MIDSPINGFLKINATIIEAGSAIALSADHETKSFSQKPFILKVEIPEEFKPGLPLKIMVILKSSNL